MKKMESGNMKIDKKTNITTDNREERERKREKHEKIKHWRKWKEGIGENKKIII